MFFNSKKRELLRAVTCSTRSWLYLILLDVISSIKYQARIELTLDSMHTNRFFTTTRRGGSWLVVIKTHMSDVILTKNCSVCTVVAGSW